MNNLEAGQQINGATCWLVALHSHNGGLLYTHTKTQFTHTYTHSDKNVMVWRREDVEQRFSNQREIISIDGVQQLIWRTPELDRVPSISTCHSGGGCGPYFTIITKNMRFLIFLPDWHCTIYGITILPQRWQLVDFHQRFITHSFTAAQVGWVHVPTTGLAVCAFTIVHYVCVCVCAWLLKGVGANNSSAWRRQILGSFRASAQNGETAKKKNR